MTEGAWIIEATELIKRFPGGSLPLTVFRSPSGEASGRHHRPFGSGKSTFLRCLNGLEEIDDGPL